MHFYPIWESSSVKLEILAELLNILHFPTKFLQFLLPFKIYVTNINSHIQHTSYLIEKQ